MPQLSLFNPEGDEAQMGVTGFSGATCLLEWSRELNLVSVPLLWAQFLGSTILISHLTSACMPLAETEGQSLVSGDMVNFSTSCLGQSRGQETGSRDT